MGFGQQGLSSTQRPTESIVGRVHLVYGPTKARTLRLVAASPREVPMGAVLFWLGIGLVIALVLLAARATDRRARHRGHHLRSSGDMSSAALEQRRDTVASDGIGHLNSDRSWTSRSRETEGRSPQTKDGA
jgi:hypothetical protein